MKLLYAEILASEGNTADAMKIVNEIRERANCDPRTETGVSVEDAMKYIKLERKIEFMGEGIRWFDKYVMALGRKIQKQNLSVITLLN